MEAAAITTAEPDLSPALARYFNRELSWLAFNARVLAEACNTHYPLLERLRFLSISGSNLDEFMMIRVAGLAAQVRSGVHNLSIDGKTPSQQLGEIITEVRKLEQTQQAILTELTALLAEQGLHIADYRRIDAAADLWLQQYFLDQVLPVITPQAIDPAHPFPFVANGGIGALFNLARVEDGSRLLEMVLIPGALPRFVRIPGERPVYIAVERVLTRYASLLFPGFTVEGDGVFRVLRDSDIEIEEEAEDLVRYFRTAIQRRRRGKVILLELDETFDPAAEALLREKLGLEQASVTKTLGMLGIVGLAEVVAEDRPDLKFAPYSPRYPERILE
ncbi:MAG: RNA degradosome polyphosphate kinase, partial [Croceibacterium sp.]